MAYSTKYNFLAQLCKTVVVFNIVRVGRIPKPLSTDKEFTILRKARIRNND